MEFLHAAGYIHFQIPKYISLGLIVVIFIVSFIWAKMEGPVAPEPLAEKAEDLLEVEDATIDALDGNVTK
jgi:hypothetical protein